MEKRTQPSRRAQPKAPTGAIKSRMPSPFGPQLATLATEVPKGQQWLHELKLDGYRLMAFINGEDIRLYTRNSHDWSARFPELRLQLARFSSTAILDGELVKLAPSGASNFGLLQEALSAKKTKGLLFYCFDLLYLDGYDLRGVALIERKHLLEETLKSLSFGSTGIVRYCEHLQGKGEDFREQVCQLSLEGIICKKKDSHYSSTRSKQWLKVKCTCYEEFVVGGFTPPEGHRSGFGSLLLGAYKGDELVYSGRVGSGFSTRQLRSLKKSLDALVLKTSPFSNPVSGTKEVTWVKPQMVVEVEFTERTRDGRLRHPVFRGVRDDRDANEIAINKEQKMFD